MRLILKSLIAAAMIAAAMILCLPALEANAAPSLPTGQKTITLISPDGGRDVIGHVAFTADGDGAKIAVQMDGAKFTNEFLSMRPFRCLAGPKRMWCHLEYPYGTPQRVTLTDLVDLEYALMFLWRPYDKVSVDAWNGLYFKLAVEDDGSIAGDLHEVDFNQLASPPPTGIIRPVTHGVSFGTVATIRSCSACTSCRRPSGRPAM